MVLDKQVHSFVLFLASFMTEGVVSVRTEAKVLKKISFPVERLTQHNLPSNHHLSLYSMTYTKLNVD